MASGSIYYFLLWGRRISRREAVRPFLGGWIKGEGRE
jgi:hypothetical protein